ncbi:hypothetical protein [Pueribacillus theae]|nr:hypothetical protein [Pueribacillus theae]
MHSKTNNDWTVAPLTKEQQEELKQLEEQLGFVLIAYTETEHEK